MLLLWAILAAIQALGVRAQGSVNRQFPSDMSSYSSLCGKTFADANATGVYSIDVNQLGSTEIIANNNISWAVTVYENATMLQRALWFSTGGLNYSDDFSLHYDSCALQLSLATTYNISDDGTCASLLDQKCIDALNNIASSTADSLVPLGSSNLTNGILPTVCNDIGSAVQNNFPKQCRPYFYTPRTVTAFGLTDHNNASGANDPHCCGDFYDSTKDCQINGTTQSQNPYWAIWQADWANANDTIYDYGNYINEPIVTVFLPIANYESSGSIGKSFSTITCPHINHYNPGSRVSPPQPVQSKKLDGGDIAGIVVGAVAAVVLIAGLSAWFWKTRRRSARAAGLAEADGSPRPDEKQVEPVELESSELAELGPGGAAQMDGGVTKRPELPATRNHEKYELPGADKPVELSPVTPMSRRPELPA